MAYGPISILTMFLRSEVGMRIQLSHRTRDHQRHITPEYRVWWGLKLQYGDLVISEAYKVRGIKMCNRWLKSFIDFYDDMGSMPTVKHGIELIDPDGMYEKDNCRWAVITKHQHDAVDQHVN